MPRGGYLGIRKSRLERFAEKYSVDWESGCWIWKAGKDKDGYGKFIKGRAHRFSYATFFTEIPKGMDVCHSCDNPSCVNPDHLWIGTNRQNKDDCVAKNRQAFGARIRPQLSVSMGIAGEICRLHHDCGYSQDKIADIVGVHQGSVSRVLRGVSWHWRVGL